MGPSDAHSRILARARRAEPKSGDRPTVFKRGDNASLFAANHVRSFRDRGGAGVAPAVVAGSGDAAVAVRGACHGGASVS